MDFSRRTIDYLFGLRQETARLERELLRLKEIERSLEQYLGDTVRSFPPSPPPTESLSSEIAFDRDNPATEERQVSTGNGRERRQPAGDLPVGELAVRILASENRSFGLDELAGRIREAVGENRSADLKNAIRVSLIRRQESVIREKRGFYRLKNGIRDTV